MSPADRIDVIKSAGTTPQIRETNSSGQLTAVDVSADDGRYETTWKFFKSNADCERTMVASPTPDKYRSWQHLATLLHPLNTRSLLTMRRSRFGRQRVGRLSEPTAGSEHV